MTDALTRLPRGDVDAVDHPDDGPKIGSWFWVTTDEEPTPQLGCLLLEGSNFYELSGMGDSRWSWQIRMSFAEFRERTRFEPNAQAIIDAKVRSCNERTQALLDEVRAVTARLGVGAEQKALADGADTAALVRVIDGQAPAEYKAALIKAKTDELPKLFKAIEASNELAAAWMKLSLLPLQREVTALQGSIAAIEQRVFHVELYAGLCEAVVCIADGPPAEPTTPIHVLQRRCYMDEECLANYTAGGMEFADIGAFDAWIAKPENRDRILPHARTIAAFRVRRYDKEREVNLNNLISVFYEKEADRATFLYLRNGERLYRLSTKIDFDEQLFPDLEASDTEGKLWAEMRAGGGVRRFITDGYYQWMLTERRAFEERCARWDAMTRDEKYAFAAANNIDVREDDTHMWHAQHKFVAEPSVDIRYELDNYQPYEPDCLYYDEISKHLAEQRNRHNRLVIVLQGLLDRSPVFHPHPPWSLWSPDGFAAALRLVYDDARALTDGDKPDFEEYRRACNESLQTGSVTVGQQDAWLKLCAERENAKYRRDRHTPYARYKPTGDPGPGLLARINQWAPRSRKATYRWRRDSKSWRNYGDSYPTSTTLPATELFNADAYQLGDYKRFFTDPRTRADYIKWAPLLLVAEDYKAGARRPEDVK